MERFRQTIMKADWGRFSVKLLPIFLAYGTFSGLLASGYAPSVGWAPFVMLGAVAACAGGYLLPRKDAYVGPLAAQVRNCVMCAIAVTVILGLALGHFDPSALPTP